ncbi:MAG: cyclic pyranopterin monophosphate synthase MoaC [Eubacterium sp.]|nr:cyclic pyranopterin monophosphate synthase MoaC [Eubacterium sp.]
MIAESGEADIVLVEGYKHASIPRIGVASEGSDYELPGEIGVYEAIVTDDVERFSAQAEKAEKSRPAAPDGLTPVFHRDDVAAIAEFILRDKGIPSDFAVASRPAVSPASSDGSSDDFTHFDDEGNARMVTVADKDITRRTATAGARVLVNPDTFALIRDGRIKKGDVLTVAQVAGIMGAKRTPDLIPMCHPIIIDGADVKLRLNEEDTSVEIEAKVTCTGRTGVEMEAITACSVAAMTVYDMCKAVQRDIVLTDIRLLSKSGGIHGDYRRDEGERPAEGENRIDKS